MLLLFLLIIKTSSLVHFLHHHHLNSRYLIKGLAVYNMFSPILYAHILLFSILFSFSSTQKQSLALHFTILILILVFLWFLLQLFVHFGQFVFTYILNLVMGALYFIGNNEMWARFFLLHSKLTASVVVCFIICVFFLGIMFLYSILRATATEKLILAAINLI